MTNVRSTGRRDPPTRRGLTLVEAVVSTVLVGVMLVAALNTVGAARLGERKIGERSRGMLLARQLMAEILGQSYEEPVDTPAFGRESSESGGDRAYYDDVDDYDRWDSSPPENKDGSEIPNLGGWRRSVTVARVHPTDLLTELFSGDTQAKCITVTVTHDDVPFAELVALKTVGLPPPKVGLKVLFVVTDVDNLTAQESARRTLVESWGYVVTLIAASEPQDVFAAAVMDADVAYVSAVVQGKYPCQQLAGAAQGVVFEAMECCDELGVAERGWTVSSQTDLNIVDNAHYITSPFSTGNAALFSAATPLFVVDHSFPMAPDMQTLAVPSSGQARPALATLDGGAQTWNGATAAGRRAALPWDGAKNFDISVLTDDGRTVLKRAIEWAANQEAVASCGDGTCDTGEGSCSCPGDCGAPPAFEAPGATCADGLDNDCDGQTDCDDINCGAEPGC